MSRALITESYLTGIANAIRAKLGVQDTYTPPQMAAAIESIPTGGITPTGTVQITQNGTHDVTQYASANVNVQPNLQSKTVTQNGTVTPDQGYDGLSSVLVDVSGGGGGGYPKVMTQGQVSTTSAYATATFDSGVDITQYYGILVVMYENGEPVAAGGVVYTSLTSKTFYLSGDREYTMSLTPTTIGCTRYTGSYRNLYVDVYGINL